MGPAVVAGAQMGARAYQGMDPDSKKGLWRFLIITGAILAVGAVIFGIVLLTKSLKAIGGMFNPLGAVSGGSPSGGGLLGGQASGKQGGGGLGGTIGFLADPLGIFSKLGINL